MATPRRILLDASRPGTFHLISRCVRRAFLCGDAAEHRRQWVLDAIRLQCGAFAVDVLAYAVMSNHLHLVVATHPERAAAWSAREVALRWARLFPRRDAQRAPCPPDETWVAAQADTPAWVAERRARLGSVSWFMKLLKERIARQANREDDCTGHFWEGRFTSVPLLDQAAITACMAYVDLNPIRAGLADRPETSDFTSIQARIRAREDARRTAALERLPSSGTSGATVAPIVPFSTGEEHLWLAPLAICRPGPDGAQPGALTRDEYLTLVDATGRHLTDGRRGAIPAHLAPILERLDLDLDAWFAVMARPRRFLGGAIGSAAALAAEALRRGVCWIVDKAGVHRPAA